MARAPTPGVREEDMAALAEALAKARRPLMIIGGCGWSDESRAALEAFAARADMPLVAAFRRQDHIDNRHPCYVGHAGIGIDPALAARIREADLLIAVGARLGEMTTSGYTLLEAPAPRQFLVHVHPSADELGHVYRPDLGIVATPEAFVAALKDLPLPEAAHRRHWRSWREEARRDYEDFLIPRLSPGPVKLEQIVAMLSDMLPEDAIITNGAGNYTAWLHRYYQYKRYPSQLAPTAGSMGYGLPAAIAAKLAHPGCTVVAFAGDGCFLMTAQELATAVQYGLRLVVIVANNAMYGTIRMHQERSYPGRVIGTTLHNPDFAALALSFGAHGEVVERTLDFRGAFERSLACGRPALIELRLSGEAITPTATLADLAPE